MEIKTARIKKRTRPFQLGSGVSRFFLMQYALQAWESAMLVVRQRMCRPILQCGMVPACRRGSRGANIDHSTSAARKALMGKPRPIRGVDYQCSGVRSWKKTKGALMMKKIIVVILSVGLTAPSLAQKAEVPEPVIPACPPDVKGNPPTVGSADPNLSDRLSDSKGIICPPAGVDPESTVRPPPTRDRNVIPPPGSPGGNPDVQPK